MRDFPVGSLGWCRNMVIELTAALAENIRLRIALHDAINRPMGVVPDSAVEFYEQDRGVNK